MQHEVARPLTAEGYADKVRAAAEQLMSKWQEENPGVPAVLETKWNRETWVMTLTVRAA